MEVIYMEGLCICIGSGLILQLCRTSQVEVVERDALSHWLYAPDGSHNDKHTNKYTHNLHMLVSHTQRGNKLKVCVHIIWGIIQERQR